MTAFMQKQTHPLNEQQKHLALIAAFAATGELPHLGAALENGLDCGLTISDCREVLVQLYAYAGFPRSLNALGILMKTVEARHLNGKSDREGSQPGPMPSPQEMLAAGTQNQIALVGSPVKGALFDFAPAADQYLKAHLFGDIFARDNLDWKSRELATVGALAALSGVEPQLKAHLGISINVGLSADQLQELVPYFKARGAEKAAQRLENELNTLTA
ncbi:carboxymuconolactone decarboxylase family protein [Candidatus Pantoea multigeneris]|uniref:Carboxymuconolactone decarboxylase n=1 Tax=Candidatus Pantoea multigeneris TaxID=2608357 RepID=A0ABX0RB40_9GAMM|nr:carboxymuconolactone decarboxylase family protein [Pantoea multigeneris]NIF21572.1 carboxymuconolactone decarboxylase [Pantoea multigeneris]